MMKTNLFCAVAVLALASCSSDSLVGDSPVTNEAPIAFTVGQRNITRATQELEATGHYNFGVWAYKTNGTSTENVMNNYLVGYSNGTDKGYDKTGISTWSNAAGTDEDHTSPWFYEKLGNKEYSYTDDAGFYKKTDAKFMSANEYQYLRYWDLAYTNTNFYAYAPYSSTGVSLSGTTLSVDKAANTSGFNDASKHDFIYAAAQAKNADKKDVKLSFKHLGAQVKVAFRENIPGYKVQLIDVTETNSGIQATPSKRTGTDTYAYTKENVTYVTSSDVNIKFENLTAPSVEAVLTDTTASGANLMFAVPTTSLTSYKANDADKTTYNVLPEGESATYATSSDVYYAVVQPSASETGFTFHVSYKLIAEDNGEVITVHDARVYVPAEQVRWASNTSYTYSFTITTSSTGTTDPNGSNIDVNSPTVPTDKALCPIVFDGATVEDYTDANPAPNAVNI